MVHCLSEMKVVLLCVIQAEYLVCYADGSHLAIINHEVDSNDLFAIILEATQVSVSPVSLQNYVCCTPWLVVLHGYVSLLWCL